MTRQAPPGLEEIIRLRAAESPSADWLLWEDEAFTWSEVLSAARRVANGLLERGVCPGDRVAILMPNSPEFLWVHFGIVFAGALSVPVNISQRGFVLEHVLRDSGAAAVVFDDALRDVVVEAARGCPALAHLVSFGGQRDGRVLHTYEDLFSAADSDPERAGGATGGVGLMYTSGTTGPPKGVVTTTYDLNSLRILLDAGGIGPGDVMYTALPLYHGNALTVSAVGSIVVDGKLALGRRFSASRHWDECRRYGAVAFNALGGIIPILLKQPPRPDDANNPVRVVLSAGAPSDDRWAEFESRFGVKLVEWFGMVDSPGTLLNAEGRPGSMGRPIGGVEFMVVDEDDRKLPPGMVGELAFRHPAGRLSYYHGNPEATEHAYRGGWFHSGDLAEADDDGYYYYRGRKKESMRRRGENISAWEIESTLVRHPAVKECAAYGVPSDLGEDEVMVSVVPVDDVGVSPEDLITFCTGRLAHYAVPRYVAMVDELPKTDTQRVQYAVLKARGTSASTWDREAQPAASPLLRGSA